ncbi:MAG: AMP-binding protein [Candidatus Competibacteraceae bacterium]
MTLRLILNGRQVVPADFDESDDAAAFSPYERHTLRFCRQWLAGQQNFVVPTSGSTGKPKAITLEREAMRASARMTGRALGLQAGDTALVCLSTEHVAGMMMLVRGFELGLGLTVVNPHRNPLAAYSEDTRFDFAAFVPLQLQEILTATPTKKAILNGMKAILVGGAPVADALLQRIATLAAPVYHTYGMTETVSHIALRRLNGPQAGDGFQPLEGVEISLGPQDCLVVRSVLTGGRPLLTNDRIELKPDGSFRWLGRLDNVINSGGFKVQAEKVEKALAQLFSQYPSLTGRRFCVGPLPDPHWTQLVIAVIEGQPVAPVIEAELRDRLRQEWLHPYEVPRYFYYRPHLLETPTGKIDRRANLAGLSVAPVALSR